MDPSARDDVDGAKDEIEEQAEKLIQLAALLLDVSHIRSDKLALNFEEFDLSELVAETVEDFRMLQKKT